MSLVSIARLTDVCPSTNEKLSLSVRKVNWCVPKYEWEVKSKRT